MTVLDHLISLLGQAAIYNRHDLARPGVVLWTDGERQWEKVAPMVANVLPGFYQWDKAGVDGFRGTSAWIRYRLGKWSGETVPVVYLPGIHRHQFRGAAGFPEAACHLYALQFQGQFCSQLNGKDWTPPAFLCSDDGGLGLDVARDQGTQQALGEQLGAVLKTPVADLRGRHLGAGDFHDLAVGDPVRVLLDWIGRGESSVNDVPAGERAAFLSYCQKNLGFDPAKDGILTAVEKLAAAEGQWAKVWSRFEEGATAWPGVRAALGQLQPQDLFATCNPRIPANNLKLEKDLGKALRDTGSLASGQAGTAVAKLAAEHSWRTTSVWARLDEAPLAIAAAHLGRMIAAMDGGVSGNAPGALAESYLAGGWVVDAEARKAWASVRGKKEDSEAVGAALRATYLPWLETTAGRLQKCAEEYPNRSAASAPAHTPEPGMVILFVDGLRTDVAKELEGALRETGSPVEAAAAWSALPTVTATAKPAWLPLSALLCGDEASENFEPTIRVGGKLCRTVEFRKLLGKCGWSWIEPSQTGDPAGSGWTEVGSIDHMGHEQGAKLAWRIGEELAGVRQRIAELLDVGWRTVKVVTDHGWLWMPGGLPKVELPKHLTVSRWGRCARPDPQASHGLPRMPWFWANEHSVVLAPGVSVFMNGVEYAHGGLTLQEALTLTLAISKGSSAGGGSPVAISGTKWVGLRLKVEITPPDPSVRLDIRRKAADPNESVFQGDAGQKEREKKPDGEGRVTLFVEDDSLAGQATILVILRDGEIVAKKSVTIGED